MAANPFVIERSQAPMQGLAMLAPAMQRRGERALVRSKEKQYMKLREDTARIMGTGTPEEVAEFVTRNPGAKAIIDETINFKSEATKRSLVEGAKRRLMGEVDPAESWLDHADLVDREGGNAAQSINAAKGAMQDPKSSEDDDLKILAMYDKPSFDSIIKLKSDAITKDTRTPAIKEFEYGEKHPKFALQQKQKMDSKRSREVSRQVFKDASDLRKEFLGQSKEYQKVRDAYTRVVGSTKDPSPAGDLSLIFNYMKMLDPGSVVRESEFATAASAGSYGERIQAATQKVLSGERLSPKMRADFLEKSGELMSGMKKQHEKREKTYGGIARKNRFPIDQVVVDINIPEQAAESIMESAEETFTEKVAPTIEEFLQKAGEANPGTPRQALIDYYNKEYGGQ